MTSLWELETSNNVLDRLKFIKRMKETIEIRKAAINTIESLLETLRNDMEKNEQPEMQQGYIEIEKKYIAEIEAERSFIAMLIDKISKYDVYFQKFSYKCVRCKENVAQCLCSSVS